MMCTVLVILIVIYRQLFEWCCQCSDQLPYFLVFCSRSVLSSFYLDFTHFLFQSEALWPFIFIQVQYCLLEFVCFNLIQISFMACFNKRCYYKPSVPVVMFRSVLIFEEVQAATNTYGNSCCCFFKPETPIVLMFQICLSFTWFED